MAKDDLQKHTLHLRRGDWDYIESIFRPNGIATSLVVRTLVSRFVDTKKIEARRENSTVGSALDIEL